MATKRYSVDPQDPPHTVTVATGSAVATKNIELTVDWDGLASAGIKGAQAIIAVRKKLDDLSHFIETKGRSAIP